MPKFRVTVQYWTPATSVVLVEADDEKEAQMIATDEVATGSPGSTAKAEPIDEVD